MPKVDSLKRLKKKKSPLAWLKQEKRIMNWRHKINSINHGKKTKPQKPQGLSRSMNRRIRGQHYDNKFENRWHGHIPIKIQFTKTDTERRFKNCIIVSHDERIKEAGVEVETSHKDVWPMLSQIFQTEINLIFQKRSHFPGQEQYENEILLTKFPQEQGYQKKSENQKNHKRIKMSTSET